jgi:hypothetical protein
MFLTNTAQEKNRDIISYGRYDKRHKKSSGVLDKKCRGKIFDDESK